MKHYYGVGGEMLHDSGITIIDDKGNIKFATLYARFSGKKHDGCPSQEFLSEYWNQYENCEAIMNENWKYRLEFRNNFTDESKKDMPHRWDPNRDWWGRHPSARPELRYTDHHVAHAAAAFATRPKHFDKEDCVIVTIDGVGEMRSSATYDHNFNLIEETNFPKSLGYLYANFTDSIQGLKSNEDEYVVMGLSCYGEPTAWESAYEMFKCIPEWTMEDQDGLENIHWQWKYKMKRLFLNKLIKHLYAATKNKEDAAASLQRMTEEVIYDYMKSARKHGSKLCYSGGVAQNIMANNRFRELFDDVWIDLNPGDGGASLGAAAYYYMQDTGADRINWEHPFLGYDITGDLDPEVVVKYIMEHKVAGVANGPAEFSYRAYGNRSLIADVRYDVKDTVNEIKQRQKFRPFAPAILAEHAEEYFDGHMNEWMQYTAQAKHDYSSVTHVDGSGRVQLVPENSKTVFRQILECYYEKTGIPMLLNTSLNIRGKPMVNNSDDAWRFEEKYNVKVFTS